MSRVILKPRKARPFFGRHPWVLDSAIERVEGEPADGDVVELCSDRGQWIARGAYNSHSRIRVRLYTWCETEPLDLAFWRRRLDAALSWRRRLFAGVPDGASRLVNSEADGLSGLIVDRYAGYLVLQVTALTMATRLEQILPILAELAQPRGIVVRAEREVVKLEKMTIVEGGRWGETPERQVFISEHGLRYGVEVGEGQKTGFFLDQRENRRVAAGYLRGRRVLDLFCHSGGFGICAAALGGAADVLGIDSSAKAVALARANAALNELTNTRFEEGDAFKTLDAMAAAGERFDAIVLDPPKFAHRRQALGEALRAYHHLNKQAVDLLEPGGILVTCSCSGHVTREDFLHVLADVAQRTGRNIQVLEQRGAAADHPVAATCLENEYLKCCVCRVA
ncbi:MAG TPA: class I SAM-dependent rRNA methyltransferase [Pirellulales bacterium]|nr:class I SAM-dependent rRNA methyltransferase [Pirellulales bacterium]